VVNRQFVPGSSLPCDTVLRRDLESMVFPCVVSGTSHSNLVGKLAVLKEAMSPALGWCTFAIADRPGYRTFAYSQGFPLRLDMLPYRLTVVEFDWSLDRYPYWEDASATSVTDPANIINNGHLPTYPTYTCTVTDTLAGGLTFTVAGKTFTYSGALVATDVLVVDPEAFTCTKNGSLDMANVLTTTDWPELVTGTNTVSKSSADFTLQVSCRERKD
jgi:hypothetical protein